MGGRGADLESRRLAVNFQEVVHSVRAGNSDVARRQRFAGVPNGHGQECPSHAQRSRGHGPVIVVPASEHVGAIVAQFEVRGSIAAIDDLIGSGNDNRNQCIKFNTVAPGQGL
jgi:hypothetical protein